MLHTFDTISNKNQRKERGLQEKKVLVVYGTKVLMLRKKNY